jgi:hypothetical protein
MSQKHEPYVYLLNPLDLIGNYLKNFKPKLGSSLALRSPKMILGACLPELKPEQVFLFVAK